MLRELQSFGLQGTSEGLADPNTGSPHSTMHQDGGVSPMMLTFATVATVIIMVVGVVGNSLTIVALLRCPRIRNVAAAFIVSLCIVDCLFCVLVLPFTALTYYYDDWTFGPTLCKVVPLIRYANVGGSLLCIALITINRYVMIAHFSLYTKIYRPVWIAAMIIFCVALTFLMQVPTFLGIWGQYAYDNKTKSCTIFPDANNNSPKTFLFITAFVIPCLIIICCYARIFWVVHSSEKRMQKHATSKNRDQRVGGPTGKERKEQKQKRNEWRITKMVLAIFLSFLLCYLPITLVKVVDSSNERPGLQILTFIMLSMSSCINPIIYVIMNKQYRQAYKTVLTCTRPRLLSTHGPGSSYGDKSKNEVSQTMVSHVSIALEPVRASQLPDHVYGDCL